MTKTDFHNSDDHLGKEIQIKCKGADLIEMDELLAFQGNLKSLSEEAYQSLKASILELGFSFPVSAWKNRNKILILDAHQRITALQRMRDEGYIVPKLPVVWVEAENETQAAKKVLAATSQYGEIQVDGLYNFMERFKLDIEEVKETFTFPEIDFESFKLTFYHNIENVVGIESPEPQPITILRHNNPLASSLPEEEWKGMPEFTQDDKGPFRTVIIHFFDQVGIDEFATLIKQKITDKTRMCWYPEIIIEKAADKRYGNHES